MNDEEKKDKADEALRTRISEILASARQQTSKRTLADDERDFGAAFDSTAVTGQDCAHEIVVAAKWAAGELDWQRTRQENIGGSPAVITSNASNKDKLKRMVEHASALAEDLADPSPTLRNLYPVELDPDRLNACLVAATAQLADALRTAQSWPDDRRFVQSQSDIRTELALLVARAMHAHGYKITAYVSDTRSTTGQSTLIQVLKIVGDAIRGLHADAKTWKKAAQRVLKEARIDVDALPPTRPEK